MPPPLRPPANPGGVYKPVLTLGLSISGSASAFGATARAALQTSFAGMFDGVNPSDVQLSVGTRRRRRGTIMHSWAPVSIEAARRRRALAYPPRTLPADRSIAFSAPVRGKAVRRWHALWRRLH